MGARSLWDCKLQERQQNSAGMLIKVLCPGAVKQEHSWLQTPSPNLRVLRHVRAHTRTAICLCTYIVAYRLVYLFAYVSIYSNICRFPGVSPARSLNSKPTPRSRNCNLKPKSERKKKSTTDLQVVADNALGTSYSESR